MREQHVHQSNPVKLNKNVGFVFGAIHTLYVFISMTMLNL